MRWPRRGTRKATEPGNRFEASSCPSNVVPLRRDRDPELLLRAGVIQVDIYSGTRWYLEEVHDLYVEVTALDGQVAVGLPLSHLSWCGPEFRLLEHEENVGLSRAITTRISYLTHA